MNEDKKTLPVGLLIAMVIFITISVTIFGSNNNQNKTANTVKQDAKAEVDNSSFKILLVL